MTESVAQTKVEQAQIMEKWLRGVCPTALFAGKTADGQPYLTDSDALKLDQFLSFRKNGVITNETLNEAVVQLWDSLTKYASDQESANFRGPYAPPPPEKPYHNMSDEVLRQAGLKRDKDGNVVKMTRFDIQVDYERTQHHNHTHDTKPKSKEEVLRDTAKSILKKMAEAAAVDGKVDPDFGNPYKPRAEALVITLMNGNIDGRRTEELRQVFGRTRDGSIDWKATYEERKKIVDIFERNRNQRSSRTGRPL
jgi:hypothetical protein